ncbi:siphovirus Gp157 family protein [Neisseria shayeganii]|uniref:Phage associated protein n=1 Tax=Neisseria shayeganii 871 TaxID=1032488 RepID=G4CG61_9NEIS|nr:siphovirus Gp157 family protein [Neisseria shayeganii]EGY53109.1 phage associated protein [Neisseria shayeganii 871]
MSNITLYQCADDVLRALNELADNDETWAQDTIEAVIGQFETKAVSVVAYAMNLGAEEEMLASHIKTMQAKLAAVKNRKERLKTYLADNMRRIGIKEIKAVDGTFSAKFAKNPPSVEIFDESQIPAELMRVKTEPDKAAIKAAIKAGQDIPGAKLLEGMESLRLK